MPALAERSLLDAARAWTCAPLDLVGRVVLGEEETTISVDLSQLLGDQLAPVRHVVRARIKRRGVEMRLVIDDGQQRSGPSRPDPALIKAVARAHKWFDDLVSGRACSFGDIAKAEHLTRRYVRALMPLAFLAPDIVVAILSGTQPVDLTAQMLTKRIELPFSWEEQRSLLSVSS